MQKVCVKVGYSTRREAVKAALSTHHRSKKSGKPSIYECSWCRQYHWGHRHPSLVQRPTLARDSHDGI